MIGSMDGGPGTAAARRVARRLLPVPGQIVAIAALLVLAACAAPATRSGTANPVGTSAQSDYLVPILGHLRQTFRTLRDVRHVGVGWPVYDTLDRGPFTEPFRGYRICVAYDPKYRLGGFTGRKTRVYWFRGGDLAYVTDDPDRRCGFVPVGSPPQLPIPNTQGT